MRWEGLDDPKQILGHDDIGGMVSNSSPKMPKSVEPNGLVTYEGIRS